jgi:ATP-dependent DNA helicase RecQ
MKLPKENTETKDNESKKAKRKSELLTSKGLDLFEALRQVRTRLAKEEGMPPYIIFSDKTLTDMCVKLPYNKEEMLGVNGVGEHKYDKYGQPFIDAILEFTNGSKQPLSYEPIVETPPQKSNNLRVKKTDFYLTDEIQQGMKHDGIVTISQFVEHLNELRDEKRMKRLAAVHLTSKLKEDGYLEERFNPLLGRNVTVVADRGLPIGMSMDKRISEKGNEYEVVMYDEEAQEFLLSLLPREVE